MSYFCIECKKEHVEEGDSVLFRTGYTLKNENKLPLGICQTKKNKLTTKIYAVK